MVAVQLNKNLSSLAHHIQTESGTAVRRRILRVSRLRAREDNRYGTVPPRRGGVGLGADAIAARGADFAFGGLELLAGGNSAGETQPGRWGSLHSPRHGGLRTGELQRGGGLGVRTARCPCRLPCVVVDLFRNSVMVDM